MGGRPRRVSASQSRTAIKKQMDNITDRLQQSEISDRDESNTPSNLLKNLTEIQIVKKDSSQSGSSTQRTPIENEGDPAVVCIIPDRDIVTYEHEVSDQDNVGIAEKYFVSPSKDDKVTSCLQCCLPRKTKYKVIDNSNEISYICEDSCLNLYKQIYGDKVVFSEKIQSSNSAVASTSRQVDKFVATRKCMECDKQIHTSELNLHWEAMEFCNEFCLLLYQRVIGSTCSYCQCSVNHTALGKYCVRFGFNVRQFCAQSCLEEFKKGLKLCTYCLKDISGEDGFLAPMGAKAQFKEFCTKICMEKYEAMSNHRIRPIGSSTKNCAVCRTMKLVNIEYIEKKARYQSFCSEPCFLAFKFVNNVEPEKCDVCCKYYDISEFLENFVFIDNICYKFCSKNCLVIYIMYHRRITPCALCKVKKYDYDMIVRYSNDGQTFKMCSLNCLSIYQGSFNQRTNCSYCNETQNALYNIKLSDGSVNNFCSYQCVIGFQNEFSHSVGLQSRPGAHNSRAVQKGYGYDSDAIQAQVPTIPIITHVESLAPTTESSTTSRRQSFTGNRTTATGMKPSATSMKSQAGLMKPSSARLAGSPMRPVGGHIRPPGNPMRPSHMPMRPPAPYKRPSAPYKKASCVAVKSTTTTMRPPPAGARPPINRARRRVTNQPDTCSATNIAPSMTALPQNNPIIPVTSTIPIVPSISDASTALEVPITPAETISVPSTTPTDDLSPDESLNTEEVPVEPIVETQIKQQFIIKSPMPPPQRNVATMCKVITADIETTSIPDKESIEIQTDEFREKTNLVPIPVPFYIPTPTWMYSMPYPMPFPFPLPLPVPVFIPSTKDSSKGIMEEVSKIQIKTPTNPLEADLLMMAEMIAEDKKDAHNCSESEGENREACDVDPPSEPPNSNISSEQKNIKDRQEVDLEGALTANTITTSSEVIVELQSASAPTSSEDDEAKGRKHSFKTPRKPARRGRKPSIQKRIVPILPVFEMSPEPATPPPAPPALATESTVKPDANMCLKFTFGVNAWKQWVALKNSEIERSSVRTKLFKSEILQLTADELNYSLCLFVKEVRKPNGQEYAPDTIYYLCLGIQQYLLENSRIDNIFCDPYYEKFTDTLDEVSRKFSILYNDAHYIVTRVEEEHLWECKQLGAHSPHVLLTTLMFFNTKYFNLSTLEEHMQLSFSHIMKHWKRNPSLAASRGVGARNVLLRFYPPHSSADLATRKRKVYEQQENEENPLRCPVKLYEFYLLKCPESVKTRNDVFYLLPERSCVPDSPVWYSTSALPQVALEKMLNRVKMIKEINVALLTG